MNPDHLIAVARQLALLEPARPRQATLRRAVSTAYYAAFHAVCRLCGDELVGWTTPWPDYGAAYRAVDHAAFKAARNAKQVDLGKSIYAILDTLVDMRERRESADYDPQPLGLTRQSVLFTIGSAEQTISAIRGLPAPDRKALAVALVLRRRSRTS